MSDEWQVTSDEQTATTAKLQEEERTQGFRDLLVWQKAMELTKAIYRISQKFPVEEKFGLVAQMRRCAVSIPSNIAEGQARHTTGEFIQFISHGEGSLAELYTQLRLAVDLGFCSESETLTAFGLMEELRKMLNALRRKLVTRH
jgi:four helix bundle protein